MRIQRAVLILLCTCTFANAQENWPCFRGPGALGVAQTAELPTSWSATENVEWKVDLPGRGWSSPVIWDDRVFITTVVNTGKTEDARKGLYFGGNRFKRPTTKHEWRVICLSLSSGEVLWNELVHEAIPDHSVHIKSSYASETPVTDGQRVYVYFGNVGVYAFTLKGKRVWEKKIPAVTTRFNWGTAASPVLHDDGLIIVNDNEGQSYLTMLDKHTGKEIWRTNRDEGSNWSTPYVWQNELRTEIIAPGTGKTRSYDLKGKLLYEFGGASSITIAQPYSQFGLLYVSSGYVLDPKKPVWAIRPGASGDITLSKNESSNKHIAWCQKGAAPYNPTTIVYGNQLYVLLDRGFVTSYDAKTGKEIYGRQRLPNGRAFTSSPWAANGHLYFLNEFGRTYVVKAGPEYELVGENDLAEDEMCMATPAIAGNRLVLRTLDRIYCIRKTKK
jgi:outer membrane protein assembly factor BamB